MRHAAALILIVLLVTACEVDRTGPDPGRAAGLSVNTSESQGPPEDFDFGEDTWRTGVFTGEGTAKAKLDCDRTADQGRQCNGFLASDVDGTLLDIRLELPPGPGPHPLVVLVHGYGGSKRSSGDIAEALLAEGYAVLRYSTRGFGDSWGQVNLADPHAEIADMRSLIGQIVDHGGYHIDGEAVALTGASYGGGHAWLGAITPEFSSPKRAPIRVRAIVPIVPWTDLLYSLAPNGRPRESRRPPGGLKLSYVNGLYSSGLRDNAARPYPNYPDYFIAWHAWMNAMEPTPADPMWRQIVDGVAGYRSVWWSRDYWRDAVANRVAIFQVQGFTDDLFPLPEAKRMLLALQSLDPLYPITTYLGDIGHPRASNKQAEVDHVLSLIKRWLAFHLKGEGAPPLPGVVHAALTRPRDEPFDAANVLTLASWNDLSTGLISTELPLSETLVNPLTDPLGGFFWDPLVMEAARELREYPAPHPPSAIVETSLGVATVPVSELTGGGPLTIAGQPTIVLHATTASARVQLNVRLIDVAPDGTRHLITRGTLTVENLSGIGEPMDIAIPTYGNYWRAEHDHELRIEISNVDSPYITPSRLASVTVVDGIRIDLPVR